MGDQVFAITKKTEDVLEALAEDPIDPNKFIFHSGLNTLKIIAKITAFNQAVDSHPKTFFVAHGQSQIPIVFAFVKFPDGKVALPVESAHDTGEQRLQTVTVDDTNINLEFYRIGSNYNVDITLYIFEAPLD